MTKLPTGTFAVARVKGGKLVPLEDAEQTQTEWEYRRAEDALLLAIARLEMVRQKDLAAEVREIWARLLTSM